MLGNNSGRVLFYGWVVVAASFFLQFVAWGTNITFGIFLVPLSAEFGWPRAMISGAFTIGSISRGPLYVIVGKLNDRYGPRLLVTVLGSTLGAGYLLLSQMSSLWHLYLFFGLSASIGMSVTAVPPASAIASWFKERRATATAIFLSGASLGGAILAPVGNRLISVYGWRTAYAILGFISLAVVLFCAQFLRRPPREMERKSHTQMDAVNAVSGNDTVGNSLQEALRTPQFWMLCAILFCGLFSHFTILVHLVSHGIDVGIPASSGAGILAVCSGMAVPGRVLAGVAADRLGTRQVLIICFALLMVSFLWLLQATGFWTIFIFAVVFGLTTGASVVLSSPIVAELYGLSSHGAIFGAVMMSGTAGGALGPLVAGYVFDMTGSYRPAMVICTAMCALAIILATFLTSAVGKNTLIAPDAH